VIFNKITLHNDDFKDANEAFENQVEVCKDEKVKTEPDTFEDEDKKPLEDRVAGGRFNACDVEKVKTKPEKFKLQIQF
jgi:hypothetical protein